MSEIPSTNIEGKGSRLVAEDPQGDVNDTIRQIAEAFNAGKVQSTMVGVSTDPEPNTKDKESE